MSNRLLNLKNGRALLMLAIIGSIAFSSCKAKYGCPSNGKNIGAERLMSGEKNLPKPKKFRA